MAVIDLDAAIALRPQDAAYRLARAQLRLEVRDRAGAIPDLQAADKVLAAQDDRRLVLAQLYQRAGGFGRAIEGYDGWIKAHAEDARLPMALAGRCWSLAASASPPSAVAACDAAVRRTSRNPSALTARGIAELKGGDDARALADFDRALVIQPQAPWALWGRALVEQKRGEVQSAAADAASARARLPGISEVAARYALPAGPALPAATATPAAKAPAAQPSPNPDEAGSDPARP
ncbi:MAG TPA: hypothetical protein VG248_07050 [Caulobacteraceae bacterium]|jgi:tetratricopeptide (TPR) repeat protein|nr:hypothetical protein [Caulobacteraceae bacterium]